MQLYDKSINIGVVPIEMGNQPKAKIGDFWYKKDYLGYEAAAEELCAKLLSFTNVDRFTDYRMNTITENGEPFTGCVSKNFVEKPWSVVTIQELIEKYSGKTVEGFFKNKSIEEKITSLVAFVE